MLDRKKVNNKVFLFNKKMIDEIYESIGTCSKCRFKEKYAGDYIHCKQINSNFPKNHFCAYFEGYKDE
jgi:hypothetical protein